MNPGEKQPEVFFFSFSLLDDYNLLSDLRLTSNAASLPRHHHLFNSLGQFLQLPLVTGLLLFFHNHLLLRLRPALSVSLWVGFSVGTGCGSAGSRRIVTDHLFLGDGIQRSCCPLLLALEWKLDLG